MLPPSALVSRRSVLRAMALGASAARPLLRAAEPDPVTARIQEDLLRHARFGVKRSGTPGDLMTAAWIAQRLRAAGYKVDELDFEAPFFVSRTVRLSAGRVSLDLHAQTPAATTPPDGVRAPLAVVRTSADAASARGKIALLVLPQGRHAALGRAGAGTRAVLDALAAAGAVGAAIITTGPSGEAALLNAPEDSPMPLPVAIMAPRHSKWFVEAAAAGAEATLIIDGEATRRPSKNVIARIERGRRWIAISTPRTGWFQCVGERGTGTAVFLELAAWAAERFPNYSIHLMNTGAHEYYFAGSHKVLHLAPPPEVTDVWAHIGASLAVRAADESGPELRMLDRADSQRYVMATPNLNPAVAEGFRGLPELERAQPVRADAGELSVFTGRGYPRCFAVIGTHCWFHTIEDTIERVDARFLTPVLEAHKRTIELAVEQARKG